MPAGVFSRQTHWLGVAAVLLSGIGMSMHVGKVPPAITAVSDELGLDLVGSGWLLSLFALLGAVIGSGVGRIADRAGQRRTLLFGLFLAALGSLLGAAADAPPFLMFCRALEGIGFVSVVVAAPALIFRESNPKDHRLAFGLWSTWMPVGAASMMALSPLLLVHFGWRANWLVAALPNLLALTLVLLLIGKDDPAPLGRPRARLRDIAKRPAPWILAVCFCCYSMSFQTVFGFLPAYLTGEQAIEPSLAAHLSALGILCNVIGNLSAGRLTRLVPRWGLIVLASLAMGLCAFGIFSAELSLPLRYGLCLAFSAFGGVIPAAIFISAPLLAPSPAHVGTMGGMIVQGLSIGQLAGPPVLGFLVHRAGSWEAAPYFIAALALASLLLGLALKRQEGLKE